MFYFWLNYWLFFKILFRMNFRLSIDIIENQSQFTNTDLSRKKYTKKKPMMSTSNVFAVPSNFHQHQNIFNLKTKITKLSRGPHNFRCPIIEANHLMTFGFLGQRWARRFGFQDYTNYEEVVG